MDKARIIVDDSYRIAGKKVTTNMDDMDIAYLISETSTVDEGSLIRFFGYSRALLLIERTNSIENIRKKQLSKIYKVGGKYVLKVLSSKQEGKIYRHSVKTKSGDSFIAEYPSPLAVDRDYVFEIQSLDMDKHHSEMFHFWMLSRFKTANQGNLSVQPLSKGSTIEHKKDQLEERTYVKSPSAWYREVEGLGYHKCGKEFRCSCCGQLYKAGQGYRIDFKDIFFCTACKREIFTPSGRGWSGIVISTPMGNKR